MLPRQHLPTDSRLFETSQEARSVFIFTRYMYALGTRPIAQNSTVWEYLLLHALGSVRQIADANGNVTHAKSYEPYGSVLMSTGAASSIFGYTGEQADSYTILACAVESHIFETEQDTQSFASHQ